MTPEKQVMERARKDKRQGKAASTQAGEFVREEIHHVREGKHGARSTKQAIAIGLSKARRAGVKLPAPKKGKTSARTRRSAQHAYQVGQGKRKPKSTSKRRSRAISKVMKQEGHSAASKSALSRQARSAASKRTAGERSRAAQTAVRTKGHATLVRAARKAARTRARGKR